MKKIVLKSRTKTKPNPVKHNVYQFNIPLKGDIDDYIYSCSWHGIKRVSER